MVSLRGRKIQVKMDRYHKEINLKKGDTIKILSSKISKETSNSGQLVVNLADLNKSLKVNDKIIIDDNRSILNVEQIIKSKAYNTNHSTYNITSYFERSNTCQIDTPKPSLLKSKPPQKSSFYNLQSLENEVSSLGSLNSPERKISSQSKAPNDYLSKLLLEESSSSHKRQSSYHRRNKSVEQEHRHSFPFEHTIIRADSQDALFFDIGTQVNYTLDLDEDDKIEMKNNKYIKNIINSNNLNQSPTINNCNIEIIGERLISATDMSESNKSSKDLVHPLNLRNCEEAESICKVEYDCTITENSSLFIPSKFYCYIKYRY